MNKDTVTIDRRVLEEAVASLEGFNNPGFIPSLVELLRGALNTTRTDEEIMRDGVAAHVRRYCNETRVLKLTVFPSIHRENSGMLTWILKYEFGSGGGITVSMIQRKPGEPVEYHS